jgi:hypothetical protein
MDGDIPPTTDELRAAFNRAPLLHMRGWNFEKSIAVPYVRWALEKSALAHRQKHHLPAQPRLI